MPSRTKKKVKTVDYRQKPREESFKDMTDSVNCGRETRRTKDSAMDLARRSLLASRRSNGHDDMMRRKNTWG